MDGFAENGLALEPAPAPVALPSGARAYQRQTERTALLVVICDDLCTEGGPGPVQQLAAAVGRTADLFGTEKALAFVESITDEDLGHAHLSPEADRPVLRAAIAHSAASAGDDMASGLLYQDALRAAHESGSKATIARVLARYVGDAVKEPDQEHDLIESLLRYLTAWGFSSASLAEKADFEAGLSTVLDYALALWSEEPTTTNRLRLGIFLDLLKRPEWVPLPARWDLDRDRQAVRSLAGLWSAMDWLGRLRVALRRHPRTPTSLTHAGLPLT